MITRFSEKAFRRYEDVIRKVLVNWPNITVIDPSPYSVETFSCRFRDAVKAHAQSHFSSELVNYPQFIQLCDEFVVSLTYAEGKVAIGPYDQFVSSGKVDFAVDEVTAKTQAIPLINLVHPPIELIPAVIMLHHYRIFTEPSIITTTLDITHYMATHDVSIEKNGDVYTIV